MSELTGTARITEMFGVVSTRAEAQAICAEASERPNTLWCAIVQHTHHNWKTQRDCVEFRYNIRFGRGEQ